MCTKKSGFPLPLQLKRETKPDPLLRPYPASPDGEEGGEEIMKVKRIPGILLVKQVGNLLIVRILIIAVHCVFLDPNGLSAAIRNMTRKH